MVASSGVSLTYNINFVLRGFYYQDIYIANPPEVRVVTTLSGSNKFNAIQFQLGATFNSGSVLLGSASPSGVVQTFDFDSQEVIDIHSTPELVSDNVKDIS